MGKSFTKVVYQPDPQSTDEFTVVVDPEQYKKWKEGDTTIPLTEVVESFQVFFSNQGSQGLLSTPSRQQLENVFGSHKDVDVVQAILEKGVAQASEGLPKFGSTNAGKGSFVDTRGSGRGVNGV